MGESKNNCLPTMSERTFHRKVKRAETDLATDGHYQKY